MAAGTEKIRAARSNYVFKRLTLRQVAALAGVSESSARRWKKQALQDGDDWDRSRSAHLVAGRGLDQITSVVVEEVVVLVQTTVEEVKNAKGIKAAEKVKMLASLADSMNKAVAAGKGAAPQLSKLAVAQEVVTRLFDFVKTKHPDQGQALLGVIEDFGAEIAKVYQS